MKTLNQKKQEMAVRTMMATCAAEADAWAERSNLAALVNRMASDEQVRSVLTKFGKQCFAEGVYEGATSVVRQALSSDGKPAND